MDINLNKFPNHIKKHVSLATSCHDCDYIPKYDKAGQVEYDDSVCKEVQYMFNGLKIIKGCYNGEWMTYVINKLHGHHEPQEEKVFYEVLQRIQRSENNIMIELGANWSYYSMWFVRKAGGGSVLIEPNSEVLKAGLANFNLNNLKCVALNGFIGRSYKESDTFIDWDSTKFIKPRYSIDFLMKYLNITDRLTLLHSDIQGAESEMLLGAEESLRADKIDYIFISTHKNNIHRSCLNILARYNYHIIASHKIRESVSSDGLIAASSPNIGKFNVKITKRYHW